VHAQPAAARPLCPSHWQAINFFFFFFLPKKKNDINGSIILNVELQPYGEAAEL
jgi:hypothetical protein